MQVFRYLDNYKTFVANYATRCLEMTANDDRGAPRYWVRTIFFSFLFLHWLIDEFKYEWRVCLCVPIPGDSL